MNADLIDEVEQITLYKYGGLPHWGKNRNYAFNDTLGRYPRLGKFLEVKARFDPDGVFSSKWSDQVLGISGSPVIQGPGCAVEGLCTCTKDSDCAPGYMCSQGKVYPDARVCTVPPQQPHCPPPPAAA
jgi:L-gulonolactone oxidase